MEREGKRTAATDAVVSVTFTSNRLGLPLSLLPCPLLYLPSGTQRCPPPTHTPLQPRASLLSSPRPLSCSPQKLGDALRAASYRRHAKPQVILPPLPYVARAHTRARSMPACRRSAMARVCSAGPLLSSLLASRRLSSSRVPLAAATRRFPTKQSTRPTTTTRTLTNAKRATAAFTM